MREGRVTIFLRVVRLAAIAAAASILCRPAFAAPDVSGTIRLPNKGAARDAVVFLEGKGLPVAAPLRRKAVMDQRSKTFLPHVLVIPRGSTVAFPNNDTVFHNVFAFYDAKRFDLGMYPRNTTKEVRFDRPGVIALLCNVHAQMSAYIYVVDTPFYAVSDRSGGFRIPNVPPGSYTLRVWHESGSRLPPRPLTVGGDGAETLSLQMEGK